MAGQVVHCANVGSTIHIAVPVTALTCWWVVGECLKEGAPSPGTTMCPDALHVPALQGDRVNQAPAPR